MTRRADEPELGPEREQALEHIKRAINVCERLGESLALCHLQHAADVIAAPAKRSPRTAVRSDLH